MEATGVYSEAIVYYLAAQSVANHDKTFKKYYLRKLEGAKLKV